ncbi:hypothetical protein M427DRAFT_54074 [Gonapodya prolifera JEL478]|uniref:UspA domain-containing protein n=1 Tax=Gonapodya prolifera (strain JEL478) TaxID=1344416 RepID=A0A139ANQ3_GONPJ|nr:hypothetical protein M427DRAFT_54074 [Gonapodya prolifera JEL478]|eukprot:KXS18274.1 hypothetical protein M427DRAFT_54074 [Gonapodya prolifera JEL478]
MMSLTGPSAPTTMTSASNASPSQPPQFKCIVLLNDSPPSWSALDRAVSMVSRIDQVYVSAFNDAIEDLPPPPYKLILVYCVGLNPPQRLPYLDHLEKSYNIEIEEEARAELLRCKEKLKKEYEGRCAYDFVHLTGTGDPAPLLCTYVSTTHPDADLCFVGTRSLHGARRWVLGSVSEYIVEHMPCPVVVVKASGGGAGHPPAEVANTAQSGQDVRSQKANGAASSSSSAPAGSTGGVLGHGHDE